MPPERWGSLSVEDHVDTRAMVANVLMYDRLVIPVMVPQEDRDEIEYWTQRNWDPALQLSRVHQLGELAVRRPWTSGYRNQFHSIYWTLS